MNVQPLVRKVLIGAAGSTLDIAGAAMLPGAWPILKGALQPVLERLKELIGGEDPASSVEAAKKAVKAFEADPILQEMMRSRLIDKLDHIVRSGEKIDTDVQKLMMIASGNQELLEQICGDTAHIARILDEGVDLNDDAINKIKEALSREAATSREVRAIALREMGPVADLLRRQVGRLQIRAVELVQEGAPDRAVDELKEGLMLVAVLLKEAPTDRQLRLHLGFIYKTLAQVHDSVGQPEQVEQYTQRAEDMFRLVQEDIANDQ